MGFVAVPAACAVAFGRALVSILDRVNTKKTHNLTTRLAAEGATSRENDSVCALGMPQDAGQALFGI